MNFDPTWLFASSILGTIGFALFIYGKKQSRLPQLVAGVLFMVYPYFLTSLVSLCGIGLLIGVALWWTIHLGW
jgi:hypothetical protein